MKNLMYWVPVLALMLFYGYIILFLDGLTALGGIVWLWIALALAASWLLTRNLWWGSLPGIAVGVLLLNAGLEGYSTVLSETFIGAFVFCYYTAVGYAKKRRKL